MYRNVSIVRSQRTVFAILFVDSWTNVDKTRNHLEWNLLHFGAAVLHSVGATTMERHFVLHLYRQLLRALEYYPSVRRKSLAKALKEEFRANRNAQGRQRTEKIELARMELKRLQVYKSIRDPANARKPSSSSDWTIQL